MQCKCRAIVDAFKTTLEERGLHWYNFLGIGTDNASVMVGLNNGVLSEAVGQEQIPSLVHIRCKGHSLQGNLQLV